MSDEMILIFTNTCSICRWRVRWRLDWIGNTLWMCETWWWFSCCMRCFIKSSFSIRLHFLFHCFCCFDKPSRNDFSGIQIYRRSAIRTVFFHIFGREILWIVQYLWDRVRNPHSHHISPNRPFCSTKQTLSI